MRAYDYRAYDAEGLALFIDKQLMNRRTFIQALGRVGRFGEKCVRCVSSELESPWDTTLEVRGLELIEAKHRRLIIRNGGNNANKRIKKAQELVDDSCRLLWE